MRVRTACYNKSNTAFSEEGSLLYWYTIGQKLTQQERAPAPEQPAAQVEQTEVIREVREKTAGAKAQSKITGKLSSQTSRLETMLRRKNPEKRLAEKYTHEERQQAMKELDEMIATATRLREIIAKVERSADEAQEV